MTKKCIDGPGFYINLGRKLRLTRHVAQKSQSEVAAHLGVTFQQVQKYENGRDRIPVDRLINLSQFLDVPVELFFSFRKLPANGKDDFPHLAKSLSRQDGRLLAFWSEVDDPELRTIILNLVRRLAKSQP